MSELVVSPSGCRGVVGDSLTAEEVLRISNNFGSWVTPKQVIIGKDTRSSGLMIESSVTAGLLNNGCEVINCGLAATPVIIHAKNKLGVKGGIIISGSHNPPEWNALKLMSADSFTSSEEIDAIMSQEPAFKKGGEIIYHDPLPAYLTDLYSLIKVRDAGLKVALDTGAGAGKLVTPQVLEKLGCEITLVNNKFIDGAFPRDPEPIAKNLSKLIELMKSGEFDIGFAHDCDADRLTIVGPGGEFFREDAGLALITKYEEGGVLVTNSASSLVFEALMGSENVIRTPVGERHLAIKMKELLDAGQHVFGGEGSCGGVMYPSFNNCRDGIFAAARLVEIMSETGKSIKELFNSLPQYYSERKNLRDVDIPSVMKKLQESFTDFEVIDHDVKVNGSDWFVLAHPSNTEPIIRLISEAPTPEKARELLELIESKI